MGGLSKNEEYEEQQKEVVKRKIEYLKKKISSGEAASLKADFSEGKEKKEVKKAVGGPISGRLHMRQRISKKETWW